MKTIKKRSNTIYWIVVVSLTVLYSCRDMEPDIIPVFHATPYAIQIPQGFPNRLNIPPDNPLTVEGIKLGRYLFYDGRISGRSHPDSVMCCSTCHLQERTFECGIDHPLFPGGHPHGIGGKPTPHVMQPLINLAWNHSGYFWNGLINKDNPDPQLRTIEDIVRLGIIAEHEIFSDTISSKMMIQNISGYSELFKKAFGSSTVTFRNISRAIEQFILTIISSNSKFDKYLRGELQLTPEELNGYVLFTTEEGGDCFHCHGGAGNPLFTTNLFYNNGKDTIFTGIYEDQRDHYHVTGDIQDIGSYRAPTLRNIIYTAPYMHDGRFETLDEVLNFYNLHVHWSPYISPLMHHVNQGGIQLTSSELNDLKAFILTLTDTSVINDLTFSKPEHFPDEE